MPGGWLFTPALGYDGFTDGTLRSLILYSECY